MPQNYFKNREDRSKEPDKIPLNSLVFIVEKHMQGTPNFEDLVLGRVIRVLSNGGHYNNGAKVVVYPIINKESLPLDRWYNDYILNFGNIDMEFYDYVDEINSFELEEDTMNTVIGRVQYFLMPPNYKPKPIISDFLLGVEGDYICDINTLNNQIDYLKSNFYIDTKDLDNIISKLIKYRTMAMLFDQEHLNSLEIYPNYCEMKIYNYKYIKENNYIEIK